MKTEKRFWIIAVIFGVLFFGCASTGEKSAEYYGNFSNQDSQSKKRNISGEFVMQVEEPSLNNIAQDSAWIPEFVVNTISDDIAKYSPIIIADSRNARKMALAQKRDESGIFDDSDLVEAGNFKVAKKVMFVSITGKNGDYSLSVRIDDKEKNTLIAGYSEPNCAFADLENGLVLKKAVADLLDQLVFPLSIAQKKALLSVKTKQFESEIEAQKLYAQGNVAMQSGADLEALKLYIQANSTDSNLERAKKSMSQFSKNVTGSGIGARVKNQIQRRNAYIELFEIMRENFRKAPPYYLIFEPKTRLGKIDYNNGYYDLLVNFALVPDPEKKKLFNVVLYALKSIIGKINKTVPLNT